MSTTPTSSNITAQHTSANLLDVSVLAALCALLQLWMSDLRLLTESTPWYTYLTGHLVHLHWQHWFMNLLAFACLPILMPRIARRSLWTATVLFALAISLLLIHMEQLATQKISSYVGLSGVLHGLYVYFALDTLTKKPDRYMRWQSILLITALVLKVCYEMFTGHSQSADFLGAAVVYAAHFDGVMLACVAFTLKLLWQRALPPRPSAKKGIP